MPDLSVTIGPLIGVEYMGRIQARGDFSASSDAVANKAMPPFAALRAFEAFGRCGGVRRAAQALGLDHAVVSRHLRGLEAWTGAKLIDRRPGVQQLTEDGERYYLRLRGAMAEIVDATSEIMRREDERRLSIWCIPGLASEWLTAKLWEFQRGNPDLDIEFHPTDSPPDFSRYEADVDIRYTMDSAEPPAEGVRRLEIARPPVFAVASPECLASLPPIATAADLLSAPLLHEENFEQWKAWFGLNEVEVTEALKGPRLWHAHLTVEAARRGQGVALANAFLLRDDLASGRLVNVMGVRKPPVVLGAYTFAGRTDRWQLSAIHRLRRWLEREAAEALGAPLPGKRQADQLNRSVRARRG
jgi:LysR family transcriptional regulator, glycine cleavage system transcriptional activator